VIPVAGVSLQFIAIKRPAATRSAFDFEGANNDFPPFLFFSFLSSSSSFKPERKQIGARVKTQGPRPDPWQDEVYYGNTVIPFPKSSPRPPPPLRNFDSCAPLRTNLAEIHVSLCRRT
jgi:hypothetical protein